MRRVVRLWKLAVVRAILDPLAFKVMRWYHARKARRNDGSIYPFW